MAKIFAAAKTTQNLTKCRVCGVFAVLIIQKKLRKHQKSVFCAFHLLGPNDIVNGFLLFLPFCPLIRSAKKPQTRHIVRYCGIFWPPFAAPFALALRHLFCPDFALPIKRRNISRSILFEAFLRPVSQKSFKTPKIRVLRLPVVGREGA